MQNRKLSVINNSSFSVGMQCGFSFLQMQTGKIECSDVMHYFTTKENNCIENNVDRRVFLLFTPCYPLKGDKH